MPFQLVIIRSSPSAKPYEQASAEVSGRRSFSCKEAHRRTCTQTFLAFLQLLQKSEVARHLCSHGVRFINV